MDNKEDNTGESPATEPRHLYNANDQLNEIGHCLDIETARVCGPIFRRYLNEGYGLREISHVMLSSLTYVELQFIMDKVWDPKD